MLNASSLSLSLVGTPAEQLKALIVFIDKLIAGCYETSHVLSLREHLVAFESKPLTDQTISDLVWLELNEAVPPYLCLEMIGGDRTRLRLVPDFENMVEGAHPDFRYIQLVDDNKDWHDVDAQDSDEFAVSYFVRGWRHSEKVELFDRNSRSVTWTYRMTPAVQ
jgi:hypothetical protein